MQIIGENILLRLMNENDTDDIIKWRNSESVRKNFIYQGLFTRESHEAWIEKMVKTDKVVQFIIIDKRIEKSVGSVYLRDIDVINNKAEYGIFIGEEDARGKGIGTEAAKLIINYGFQTLKLNKIFLRVLADNYSAIKSYKNAGFEEEGLFKQDIFINGKYFDLVFMALLNNNR